MFTRIRLIELSNVTNEREDHKKAVTGTILKRIQCTIYTNMFTFGTNMYIWGPKALF